MYDLNLYFVALFGEFFGLWCVYLDYDVLNLNSGGYFGHWNSEIQCTLSFLEKTNQ